MSSRRGSHQRGDIGRPLLWPCLMGQSPLKLHHEVVLHATLQDDQLLMSCWVTLPFCAIPHSHAVLLRARRVVAAQQLTRPSTSPGSASHLGYRGMPIGFWLDAQAALWAGQAGAGDGGDADLQRPRTAQPRAREQALLRFLPGGGARAGVGQVPPAGGAAALPAGHDPLAPSVHSMAASSHRPLWSGHDTSMLMATVTLRCGVGLWPLAIHIAALPPEFGVQLQH